MTDKPIAEYTFEEAQERIKEMPAEEKEEAFNYFKGAGSARFHQHILERNMPACACIHSTYLERVTDAELETIADFACFNGGNVLQARQQYADQLTEKQMNSVINELSSWSALYSNFLQ